MPEPIPTTDIVLGSLPPKTPAAEEILSPPSTEPSISRPESKDTPPPSDLALSAQGSIGGRPSRRVRAQVSYKEPSLNTKMRRPGKELVDAVIPDQTRRTSVEPQITSSIAGRTSLSEEQSSTWKPLGAISGRSGEEDGEVGSPLRQKLDRRDGPQDSKAEPPRLNSATASNAISAMIQETRRKSLGSNSSSSAKVKFEAPDFKSQTTVDEATKPGVDSIKKEDLAIFDFNESSPRTAVDPPASTTAVASSRPRIDLAKAARSARRHSAVPSSATLSAGGDHTDDHKKAGGALPSVHKRTASGTIRSSSVSSLTSGKSSGAAKEKERSKRDATKVTSASAMDIPSRPEVDSTGSTREERAASRRRSMML